MKIALKLALFALAAFALCATATAADKNDPTGTWTVKAKLGKREIESKLVLEYKDGKVTGTMSAAKGGDSKVEDGTFKDGTLKFTVTREVKDNKIVTKYEAKIDGDTMKGTVALDFNGKEIKSDFEGTREKK
jgi:hypothetical protein